MHDPIPSFGGIPLSKILSEIVLSCSLREKSTTATRKMINWVKAFS